MFKLFSRFHKHMKVEANVNGYWFIGLSLMGWLIGTVATVLDFTCGK